MRSPVDQPSACGPRAAVGCAGPARNIRPLIFALLAAAWAVAGHAQVVVQKSPYAILTSLPPFTGEPALADEATRILTSDLERSGWFKIVAPGGSEIHVVGMAQRSGGGFTLEVRIYGRGPAPGTPGGQIYGQRFRGETDGELRRVVHALADDIVAQVAKQKGIAQTQIAFISSRTGKKELYVCDYDGYGVRQITHDGSISARPRWSPDRRYLVYLSYKSRWPDVYLIELASGTRRRIAAYPGLNSGATFSPAGNRLALSLSKDGNPELYTMEPQGGGLQRLTHSRAAESAPTWSPDGARIAYTYDGTGLPAIWVMSAQGGGATRLTPGGYFSEPDWSPTGNLIACVGRVGGRFHIFTFDPDNPRATLQQRTHDGADNEDPTWAPNGRHLVFSKKINYRGQLYVLDVLTGSVTSLGLNLGDCVEPAWSR